MPKADLDPPRMWSTMVAALHICFGCKRTLRNSAATIDSFCRDCVDRSRLADGDEIGGEA